MADAKRELKGFAQAGEAMRNVGTDLAKYVSAPIAAFGGISLAASAKLESLRSGLQAIAQQELGKQGITGLTAIQQAAEQTGARLVILQNLAKAPGLGLEAAEGADIRLRAVGTAAEESAREIKAFANAIATTGGGKTQFELVTTQLSQMAAKGKVLANDLKPIIESAPAVAAALQTLYGTVDSETISASLTKQGQSSKDFIRVLTDELAKLPQVTGGLKAIYENDMDALLVSSAKVGDGLAKALNLQAVGEQLGNQITALGDGFANLSAPTQQLIAVLGLGAAATGPLLVGLGTLGLALPNIKTGFLAVETAVKVLSTGFAALLNPTTLAIAGLAALAGGAYYLATANERAHQSFLDQAAATRQLTTEVSPLLDRYEQLKAKTNLSAKEQDELRVIIEKVAQLMPEAATKIDGYGKVIDIAADKARKFIASNQGITKALALEDLPKQQAKLEKLEKQYANLTRQSEEFNRTGRVTITPGDKTSYGFDELGKTFFADLQTNLNATSTALATQRKELEQTQQSAGVYAGTLRGQLTPALTETDLALKFLGGQGKETTGLLAGLHDQLTKLRQEQQDAPTAQLALAYVPLIKNLQDYIARLEGTDKASKKTSDAVAKLRLELSRLTALDNLLGDAPNQMQVLERRSDTLAKGLKTLVDAGVSPSSRAFRSFAEELVNVSQAVDTLQAKGGTLDLKPVAVKSLIPTTIGDTLPQDVARLLGDYAKQAKPFELPIAVKLNMQALTDAQIPVQLLAKDLAALSNAKPDWDGFVPKTLNAELLNLGAAFRQIDGAQQLGLSFDSAGAKAQAMQTAIQNLIPTLGNSSAALQQFSAQFQALSLNSQIAQELKTSIMQLAGGIATAFSDSISGVQSFGDSLASTLLSTVGDLAVKLGSIILASGLGIQALMTSLQTFTGLPAIAAGLGLLAIGGIAKGAVANLGNSAGSASTSITPLKVSNYGQTSNQTTIKVLAEFVLRGKDLAAVGKLQNYRNKVGD